MAIRFPDPSLVVLVAPSAAGKSTWATTSFAPEQVVSSDRLRGVVGEHEADQQASTDAFFLLDEIVRRRLARGLTTVVDTTGLDPERRAAWRALAQAAGVPAFAVGFDAPAELIRERNRAASHPVPARVIDGQLRRWRALRGAFDDPSRLDDGAWDGVHLVSAAGPGEDAVMVTATMARADVAAARQLADPVGLRFGLQLPRFTWEGGTAATVATLADIAARAEAAGFETLWVMDHFRQIPQVGRAWEDMLECFTTLGYLAGITDRIGLGPLVAGVTYRNPALLGKMVATLDVLSGGRAWCGLGAAWFGAEHTAYGWRFPPDRERLDLLEDTLRLLPLLWGRGSPAFAGKVISVPEAMCYPRPLQEHVPILVGGSGERRTLRLVAAHADACNLFGDAAVVRHKVDVLHRHCNELERDPDDVLVTHLRPVLAAGARAALDDKLGDLVPRHASRARYAAAMNAGTVDDHVGAFRELADAGVGKAIVSLPDVDRPGSIETAAEIIAAFR